MSNTMNVFDNIVKHIDVLGAQWHMTFLTKVECHIVECDTYGLLSISFMKNESFLS